MSDLALVATTLKVAEKSKILYEESPNYTEEELLADIGGSLGLILGLNLLDVLIFSGSVQGSKIAFKILIIIRELNPGEVTKLVIQRLLRIFGTKVSFYVC